MLVSLCFQNRLAIQNWVLTAFSEVPKKSSMRRCCVIQLKNGSTCQRLRVRSATVCAGMAKLLVRNLKVFPVGSSGTLDRRNPGFAALAGDA